MIEIEAEMMLGEIMHEETAGMGGGNEEWCDKPSMVKTSWNQSG